MMTIKVGDLVMVVNPSPCCGFKRGLGSVFVVADISTDMFECGGCHQIYESTSVAKETRGRVFIGTQMSRVIKIDPPALQETECAWKPNTRPVLYYVKATEK
jgi:hypothetical protein